MNDFQPLAGTQPHGAQSLGTLKAANVVAFAVTLFVNFLGGTGNKSGIGAALGLQYSIADVSEKYPTAITPSGPAFSIWAVIYFTQALFLVSQFMGGADGHVSAIGWWLVGASLFNCLWIATFVQGTVAALWVSTALCFALLFCLATIYRRAALWQPSSAHPWTTKKEGCCQQAWSTASLEVPFSMYPAWVSVACALGLASALSASGWQGQPLSTEFWSSGVPWVLAAVGLWQAYINQDFVWPAVTAWAAAWIAHANPVGGATRMSTMLVVVVSGSASAAAVCTGLIRLVVDR